MILKKSHFQPRSLTWWASVVPLFAGIFIATEPLHGLTEWTVVVENVTGLSGPMLINLGLGGIGLRGALK